MDKILIYGYGNPGRQDDGLGIILVDMIAEWAKENNHTHIVTDTNYQLNIEDAYNLNDYKTVIFVDASIEEIENHKLDQINPKINPQFSMHSVSPHFIIGLCQEIYGKYPSTFLFHIKGYEWEFMKDISSKADENLHSAFIFLTKKLTDKSLY